jgi:predicted site-specific integrase-resolvase
MRIAIYARVSTKDKGRDTGNQLVQLREFASKQGWLIVREFVDRETGSKSDRAQFQAMFEDASRRQFDLLLFWALDRLSREGVLETLQHLNRLTSYGVGFRSFTEQYFDSCGIFKDAVISILANKSCSIMWASFYRTNQDLTAVASTADSQHHGKRSCFSLFSSCFRSKSRHRETNRAVQPRPGDALFRPLSR